MLSFSFYWKIFYMPSVVEKHEVWLVFGASVKRNLEPSDILRDRLDVAIYTYEIWKIEKIIVSWDNSEKNYNEPVAMRQYLVDKWVTADDIYMDYAWFDTYDSLYRLKYVFGVDDVLLFTQEFHLKRAIYIGERLWIKSQGVATNLRGYFKDDYNNRREILARIKAFLDIEINNSKPKFLWPLIDMSKPQEPEAIIGL